MRDYLVGRENEVDDETPKFSARPSHNCACILPPNASRGDLPQPTAAPSCALYTPSFDPPSRIAREHTPLASRRTRANECCLYKERGGAQVLYSNRAHKTLALPPRSKNQLMVKKPLLSASTSRREARKVLRALECLSLGGTASSAALRGAANSAPSSCLREAR
jgi:hypothetical protein